MAKISHMVFYPISSSCLEECADLFVEVFNNPPWNESWLKEFAYERLDDCYRTPNFRGLIAKAEEISLGFVMGYVERWDTNKHFYLKEMCVSTKLHRSGIGSQLLKKLEEMIGDEDIQKIIIHTARNSPAQSFYEAQGFYTSEKIIMMGKWLKANESS